MSITLSEPIARKCKEIFNKCSQCNSNEDLLATFQETEALKVHISNLPQVNTTEARVVQTFSKLCEWDFYEDDPVILIFIRRLFPYASIDPLYGELEKLYLDVDMDICQHYPRHYPSLSTLGLTSKQIADLANRLLQCPSMRFERDEVWSGLRNEITVPHKTSIDVADVLSMIRACSSLDKIERLIRLVGEKDHNIDAWKALNFTWITVMSNASYEYLRELENIIEEMKQPEKLWRNAYTRSCPKGWEALRGGSLFESLEHLGQRRVQSTDVYPLWEFTERLAQYAGDHQQTEFMLKLRAWIFRRATALNVQSDRLIALRNKIAQENRARPAKFYLLVSLAPNEGEETFHLKASLRDDENTLVLEHLFIHIDEEAETVERLLLADIPKGIENLLKQCAMYLKEQSESREYTLQIEFFLPVPMLNHPVEQWTFNDGFESDELGSQYLVVVRPYDRPHKIISMSIWENKWIEFRSIVDGISIPKARSIWVCDKRYREYRAMKAAFSETLCLALTFDDGEISSQLPQILDAMLATGIPVALWSRKYVEAITTKFYQELLCWEQIDELSRLVQEQRREALE
ncbi:MAG: hypothetical protein WCD86_07400, partial [Ktedonobacteraceae bacterium]